MFSNAELTSMRATLAELMPDSCAILSVTNTPDGQGGQTQTWGTVTASVQCRLDPFRGKEVMVGDARQPFNGYVLTLPHDTTITAANRVILGTSTYNVTSVDLNKSWAITRRAYVEKA